MTEKIKVSIVVPVYNAEKTLKRCVDSILQQSYSNWELLLVDDGSTDRSKKICDSYCQEDDRVAYYRKKNGGVSSARNYGIDKACGEYISFVDSDDWIESYTLEKMIKKIADDVDYVLPRCRGVYYTENGEFEKNVYDSDEYEITVRSEELPLMFEKMWHDSLLFSVCGRIYKTELLNKWSVRFNEQLKVLEDLCFNLEYLKHVSKLCHISDVTYNYTIVNAKGYRDKRAYSAFVNGIDSVFCAIQMFLDKINIEDRRKYVDFIIQYWIMATENVLQNESNFLKRRIALKKIATYVKRENLLKNCTTGNIDTQYKVFFSTESIILFRLVMMLKIIKGKIRNVR